MDANDLTTVTDDYAIGKDYSITLKDDGKPLYMWGNQVKRRMMCACMPRYLYLAWWKGESAKLLLQSAKLVVKHVVTNNPNDQIRPEDLENEAAIGRLPSYTVTGAGTTEVWKSLKDCYEGDGDLIDSTEGSSDPTQILAGTIFKNIPFAIAAPDGTDIPQ